MKDTLFNFISKYIILTEEEKYAIDSLYSFHKPKKGDVLLKQGQYCNETFIILKGGIRTYYIMDGEEITTSFYSEMEALPPNSVLNNEPSQYFISCFEDSVITSSNRIMKDTTFENFPKFEKLYRVLLEELLVKNKYDFDEFKTSSPEQRYLNLIKNRPNLLNRVPQHQLASYLGIKPPSLSRIRSRIAKVSA